MRKGHQLANRYELMDRRGSGGMADVWEGVDHNLNRRVAIKILHPHLAADPQFLSRFRTEAHAAARLTHPGIVGIYDTVTTEETDAIIMELVDGQDLRTLLDQRPTLALDDAVEVSIQMAAALAHAHQHDIIHRDMKPANILVRPDRRVKLSDFGIAKALDQVGHTESGSLVGTVKYLSPEQLEGKTVDARTDLYGLTTVLYEMLCGQVPFATNDLMTAMSRVKTDPPSARKIRPDISDSLDRFLLRGLARNPDARYPNAETWSATLSATVRPNTATVVAPRPPESIPQRTPQPGPRTVVAPTPAPIQTPGPSPKTAVVEPPAAVPEPARPSGASSPRRAPAKANPEVAKHHRRNRSRLSMVGPMLALGLMAAAVVVVWLLISSNFSTVDSTDSSEQSAPAAVEETGEAAPADEVPPEPTSSTEAPGTDDSGDSSTPSTGTEDPQADGPGAAPIGETITEATTEPPLVRPFSNGVRTIAFDPLGDNDEHDEAAPRAIDGDLTTFWFTQSYANRSFGNIKDGVGLILEFDSPQPMTEISVDASRLGWATRIYVAPEPAADLDGWGEPIATFSELGQQATLDVPDQEVTSVLLWITDVGLDPTQSPEDYAAQVAEGGFDQRIEINEMTLIG